MVILSKQLEQKQKYAAWKAADIRKALKEGRKPVPGPPAGEEDLFLLSSTPTISYVSFLCLDRCWTYLLHCQCI